MSMTYRSDKRRGADGRRVRKYFEYVDTETGELVPDPGRTRQDFKDQTNIEWILNKCMHEDDTRWIDEHQEWVEAAKGQVIDGGNMTYHELQNVLASSEQEFASLPSAVRLAFQNDSAQFMDFVRSSDGPEKLQEMITSSKSPVTKKGSIGHAAGVKGPEGRPKTVSEPSGEGGDPE